MADEWRKYVESLREFEQGDIAVLYRLKQVASLGPSALRLCDGGIRSMMQSSGVRQCAPHIDINRVRWWFRGIKHFPKIDSLTTALSPGVSVDVASGGNLDAGFKYDNHKGVNDFSDQIYHQIVQDVLNRPSLIFDRQCVCEISNYLVPPLGAVVRPKFRIIHGLTFSPRQCDHSSVNADTDFSERRCVKLVTSCVRF